MRSALFSSEQQKDQSDLFRLILKEIYPRDHQINVWNLVKMQLVTLNKEYQTNGCFVSPVP